MKFFIDNILLFAVAFTAGGFLVWPLIAKTRQGETASTGAAIGLMNNEDAVLLDVRSTDEFARGHVAQAKNIPAPLLAERMAELKKDKPVIVLCQNGTSAGTSANALRAAGFSRVLVLDGGLSAWVAASLPVIKS